MGSLMALDILFFKAFSSCYFNTLFHFTFIHPRYVYYPDMCVLPGMCIAPVCILSGMCITLVCVSHGMCITPMCVLVWYHPGMCITPACKNNESRIYVAFI